MNLWLFWDLGWCCFLQYQKVQRPGGQKKNLAQVSTPISPCVSKGCLFSGVKLLHLRSTSHSFQVTLFPPPKHLLQIPKLLPDVQNSQMIHWSSPLCRYWLQGRGKRGKKKRKKKLGALKCLHKRAIYSADWIPVEWVVAAAVWLSLQPVWGYELIPYLHINVRLYLLLLE